MSWFFALLVGCYPTEVYRDDHDEALCAWKAACFAEDEADCLDAAVAARSDLADTCDYVGKEARECVDGLEQLECPADADALGFPTACDRVWDCP